MTRDDIIRMARVAAAQHGHTFKDSPSPETVEFLEAFHALVTGAEREACAQVCDACTWADEAADAIRARRTA